MRLDRQLKLVALALLVAGTTAAAVGPTPAVAGVYTFYSCRTPTGAAAGTSDWAYTARYGASGALTSACPGGPLTMALAPNASHPSDDQTRMTLRAPLDTTVRAYTLYRSVRLGSRYHYWQKDVVPPPWEMVQMCHTTSVETPCSALGDPLVPLGASNVIQTADRSNLGGIDLLLTCGEYDSTSTACPAANPSAVLKLHRADITLFDAYAPTFDGSPTGPLVQSQVVLTGVQPVAVAASDRGGGVGRVSVEVDGKIAASAVLDDNGGQCHEPYTTARPCPARAAGTLSVDTAKLPDGPHLVRLLVTDATGTNAADWGPARITTANDACNPSPRVGGLNLSAALVARAGAAGTEPVLRSRLRVPYGQKVTVVGTLAEPTGAPVANADVCVVGREDMNGAATRAYGTAVTDAQGRFTFDVPGGASRAISVVRRIPGGAVVSDVSTAVRASVSLRASRSRLRNGGRVRFRGHLRYGPMPQRRVIVEMQAQRGKRWQTFGTASARNGRFSYAYRFTRTTGVQRYRIRARVAAQAIYPFESGASRRVTIRVSGS